MKKRLFLTLLLSIDICIDVVLQTMADVTREDLVMTPTSFATRHGLHAASWQSIFDDLQATQIQDLQYTFDGDDYLLVCVCR